MNLTEANAELVRLSRLPDDALDYTKRQVQEYATAERDYRKAKAEAWTTAPAGSVAERTAHVDGITADGRNRRDLADGMRRLGLEAIRSRRAQLSAWQTGMNTERAEMELARTGPEL